MANANPSPGAPDWFSEVEPAETVADASSAPWDSTVDMVVVGYGGAGVAAALRGAELGLSVAALDRFNSGGSTAMNGGIVYAGGGTVIQREAGYDDTPEEMFKYLHMEAQGVVSDATLRRFCEESPALIDWLMHHGVRFDATTYPHKTSYPPLKYYLYHSDSSLSGRYSAVSKPAPRGHKVFSSIQNKTATGFGTALWEPLRASAERLGVKEYPSSEVRRLIRDRDGRVVGVVALMFAPGSPAAARHARYRQLSRRLLLALPPQFPGGKYLWKLGAHYSAKAHELEQRHRVEHRIRARHGVVLSAGGFVFNRPMVETIAPKYAAGMPLGNPGDDGSGIRLGQTAGGEVDRMEHLSAWRFVNPPLALARAMIVDRAGARFCDEAWYGSAIAYEMCEHHGGQGWLVLDRRLYREAWRNVLRDKLLPFQRDPVILALLFQRRKAATLDALADKMGFDRAIFAETVRRYNAAAAGKEADPFEKSPDDMAAFGAGPYYAIDVSITSRLFPLTTLTLGGLKVDEESGAVRTNGGVVEGLYAAGRNAVGICSHLYVSGLSAADCMFSGRRAAAAIAQRRVAPAGQTHKSNAEI